MRGRFGRRHRRGSESEGRPAIEARWLERIAGSSVVPVERLEGVSLEGVPDSFALLGQGESASGSAWRVAFSPRAGGDAVLAALAWNAGSEGFAGETVALSPVWRAPDRRLLGALAAGSASLRGLAIADEDAQPTVAPELAPEATVVDVARVSAQLADPAARAVFERALEGLRGLAAKHGGAVCGSGGAVELVILARRVASLLAEDGPRLETFIPSRSSARLDEASLSEVLDRLEGYVRKRLNEKRVRDGEEGLRGRALAPLRVAAGLRSAEPWPVGGAELHRLDLVGVAADGSPVLGAIRERLDLAGVAEILETGLGLEGALPVLLARAEAPVRIGRPRWLLAATETVAAVDHALAGLALDIDRFEIRDASAARPVVVAHGAVAAGLAARPRPASTAPPAQPRREEREERDDGRSSAAGEGSEAEDGSRDARRGARGGRRRRGRGRRPGAGADVADAALDAPEAGADRPEAGADRGGRDAESGFEELSLFDLGDGDDAGDEGSTRRRRRRRRKRSSGEAAVSTPDGGPGREGGSSRGQEDGRGGRGGRGGGRDSRRRSRSRSDSDSDSAPAAEANGDGDGDGDDEDLLGLAPEAPEDIEEDVDSSYDAEELAEEPLTQGERMRIERERRRLARLAKVGPDTPAEAEEGTAGGLLGEPEDEAAEPQLPRGRAAILALAERDAVAAALLLAREVRNIEGLWVYPQDELMTFFRSVCTDLRENTPIYVVGFVARPARDAIQAASLYRDRIVWFDHHEWPPEDLGALREAIGPGMVHVHEGCDSVLPLVVATCGRRSRFTDKLVDLVTGRFTQHDFERWGRLWWSRLGFMAETSGDHRAAVEPLLAGRPSDLAKQAARVPAPPAPPEVAWVAERDFRLVHFGGFVLAVADVPAELSVHLVGRVLRERYGAGLSLVRAEGGEVFVLGSDEASGRRALDAGAMADHLDAKFSWVESLPHADHVARFRARLGGDPGRVDELVSEIAMGRSILEG